MAKIPKRLVWIFSILIFILLLVSLYRVYFFYHYRPGLQALSGKTLWLGLRYDARMLSILGMVMLALSFIPGLNIQKRDTPGFFWQIFLVAIALVLVIFYISDFFHYDYLQQRLNASVSNYLQDAAISMKMVWQTYPIIWISLGIIFSAWLAWKMHRAFFISLSKNNFNVSKRMARLLNISAFLFFAFFIFGRAGQYPLRWSDAFSLGNDFKANAALNPFQSFFSTLKFKNKSYDLQFVKDNYGLMAHYLGVENPDITTLNFTRQAAGDSLPSTRPNIIIVICESFSAAKSSMFGNPLDPTPYFAGLCRGGVFYERCFVPAFGTARGVWAVITGIPDVEEQRTASRNPLAVDQFSIMNEFAGYDKSYFLGGSTSWANLRGLLQNNIEDLHIYEEGSFDARTVDVWGISDKNLFLEANKILAKKTAPFISIIQTADNHRPYTIPEEDRTAFQVKDFPADTLKKYGFENNAQFNAFRYTDYCYQVFMQAAARERYFANTIFVFVGDHGIRGEAGPGFPGSFTKQGIMAQHVPLLFYSPARLAAERIAAPVSQMDILPSVAGLAGIGFRNTTMGINLFDSSQVRGHYAFIADPELATAGLVTDSFFFAHNRRTGKDEFVSVINDNPVPADNYHHEKEAELKKLSLALFATAQYMLLHNKKGK
ncbi:MAG: sulfatase-like hydrolase/transferase [Ferruginibacter sp.]